METIIVKESGVVVFGDDLDGPDAQDAREAELRKTAEELLAKAERLRKTAEKLLARAKAAEEAATAKEAACLPQTDTERGYDEWGEDPDPLVLLNVDERKVGHPVVQLTDEERKAKERARYAKRRAKLGKTVTPRPKLTPEERTERRRERQRAYQKKRAEQARRWRELKAQAVREGLALNETRTDLIYVP